jgi:Flp pilus assembly protein TadD
MNTPASQPDFGLLARILILVLAGFLAFSPALKGGWLWDDDSEVTAHAALRKLNGIERIWTAQSSVDYLPLKSTVQWTYYRFVGEEPEAWRLLNIVLHLAGALMAWHLFARLGIRQAWLGALLFAIHPLNVASVCWISELKNTVSLPFLLGAMLAFLNYDTRRDTHALAWSVLLFALALLCKSSVMMFPFVILLYGWWRQASLPELPPLPAPFRGLAVRFPHAGCFLRAPLGIPWRIVAVSVPFFALSLFMGLLTVHFQYARAIGPETLSGYGSPLSRYALSGASALFYLWQAVFPFNLLPTYPRWVIDPPSLPQLLAWPVILAAFAFCWTRRRSWGRHAFLGLGFFLINLLPILGFIRISYMRITWASDHFTYIPLVGFAGLAAAGMGALWEKFADPQARRTLTVAGLALFALLLIQTHRYAGVYLNEETMWFYTLQRNPEAWQAHNRLSAAMNRKGNADAAFYHAGEALRQRPDLPETHNNYGAALIRKNRLDEALAEMEKAVALGPYSPTYKMNLANMYVRLKRYEEAAQLYRDVLQLTPNDPMLLANYAAALFFLGKNDDAIEVLEQVVAINPNITFAQRNLALARKVKAAGAIFPLQTGTASVPAMEVLDSDQPLRFIPPR